jgi:hypothetical protein
MTVNKDKSIIMLSPFVYCAKVFATCFDLQEVIIRCTCKNSVLLLELYFNMDPYYYIFFISDREYYLTVKYS